MDDLVKRLREQKDYKVDGFTPVTTINPLCAEAADRIEELEATLQRERAMGVLLAIDGELYGDTQKSV